MEIQLPEPQFSEGAHISIILSYETLSFVHSKSDFLTLPKLITELMLLCLSFSQSYHLT